MFINYEDSVLPDHPQLIKIEDEIIEIFQSLALYKESNVKLNTIAGYFFIYHSLTQDQIRRRSRYSKGHISNITRDLLDKKMIKEIILKGRNKKRYNSQVNIVNFSLFILKMSFTRVNTINNQINQILNDDAYKFQNKSEFLLNRLKFFQRFLGYLSSYYLNGISHINYETNMDVVKNIFEKPNSHINLTEFPIEKKNIKNLVEDEFKLFKDKIGFIAEEISSILHTSKGFPSIFRSLILNESLSQEELRNLTGLSMGSISQIIRYLVKIGLVEQSKKVNSRKKSYSVIIDEKVFFKKIFELNHQYILLKPKFEKMRYELDLKYAELSEQIGYYQLYTFISQFLRIIELYEQLSKFPIPESIAK